MYVAITGAGKNRVIQFREDTHIPGTKKKKTKVVKTLGNYERLLAENPNIIAELKLEAAQYTKEQKASKAPLNIQLSVANIISQEDVVPSYRFGHSIIKQLWQKMSLDIFLQKNCGKKNAESVANALYYLVAHRCTDPNSIRASALEQSTYAGVPNLGLDVFYDVLDVLSEQKENIVAHLASFFEKRTDREKSEAFYDVTTYAFESTKWGELRMFGFSKDHKNNEVQVVMGLLMDNNGIPITYELFSGNTMDQTTLVKAVDKLKKLYKLEKITVVADRGLNSGKNLEYLCQDGHDFIISYTLKRSSHEFKELVWDENGWIETTTTETSEVVFREKVVNHSLKVKVLLDKSDEETIPKRGRPKKYEEKEIPVKIHLTWSAKRANKDRLDRERILEKLRKRLDKPYQLKAAIKRGANQYLQMEIDTENWILDENKIIEAARYDGYYAVITNNLELETSEVCQIYRGLWKIEESFRILKTDLRARPVFVWNDEHIKGHFVMCYISLCLLRYIQYILIKEKQIQTSAATIMEALYEPLALVQGEFPNNIVTPTRIPQLYLDLADLLKFPTLKTNMTLTQFRSSTKLDLSVNLK